MRPLCILRPRICKLTEILRAATHIFQEKLRLSIFVSDILENIGTNHLGIHHLICIIYLKFGIKSFIKIEKKIHNACWNNEKFFYRVYRFVRSNDTAASILFVVNLFHFTTTSINFGKAF
jgi:hypothetical protein